jgi:hypothetical protein
VPACREFHKVFHMKRDVNAPTVLPPWHVILHAAARRRKRRGGLRAAAVEIRRALR